MWAEEKLRQAELKKSSTDKTSLINDVITMNEVATFKEILKWL